MTRQQSDKATRSQQNSTRQQQQSNVTTTARLKLSSDDQRRQTGVFSSYKFSVNSPNFRLSVFVVLISALILTAIAFFSSSWLEVESRFYGSKFRKLGLWRICFNSYIAPDDLQLKKFYVGCRYIFSDEYKPIRKFLLPAFFIATQVLYTVGFLLLVLVCASILAVQQWFVIEREDHVFRALSIASLLSAIFCSLALGIFGQSSDQYDWLPDPDHNNLSWSFAAGLIGSLLLWAASLLFYVEMQLTYWRDYRSGGAGD